MLEILGKSVTIIHRQKFGKNLKLDFTEKLKREIFSGIKRGVDEGAIFGDNKAVIGWWKVIKIHKNPLIN